MILENKIVWITGASNGIGKQLAIDLARKKCRLILSSRNLDKLNETCRECRKSTPFVEVLPLDLADTAALTKKPSEAISIFGNIDMLINCGGISQRSLIAETDISVDRKLMEVDYLGVVVLSKALLPYFIQNRTGTFVVVSSVMGMYSSPYRSAYCGAKHALHGFFDALRMEHEKDGIKVTIVCPGFVNTDITRNALAGNGSSYGEQDELTEKGMRVDLFSRKMIRSIEKEKFEVYIGGREAMAVYVKRFFPRLLHRIVTRSRVR